MTRCNIRWMWRLTGEAWLVPSSEEAKEMQLTSFRMTRLEMSLPGERRSEMLLHPEAFPLIPPQQLRTITPLPCFAFLSALPSRCHPLAPLSRSGETCRSSGVSHG